MNVELLEEAKKRYPIGTIINSLGGSCNQIILHDKPFFVDIESDDRIRFNGDQLVYTNGKWAEIVSLPEIISIKEDHNYLINFLKRLNIC